MSYNICFVYILRVRKQFIVCISRFECILGCKMYNPIWPPLNWLRTMGRKIFVKWSYVIHVFFFLLQPSSSMNGSVCLSVCPSVRLSVCLSVRLSVTPFWLCPHHRIIMKFSGVITNDRSEVHAKGQGQRSKVKVTEVNTQHSRFRTATPVWIHIWWWNDAQSLILLRICVILFFKVICQISSSHGTKNRRFWHELSVSGL